MHERESFATAALIVARCLLPRHPSVRFYFHDLAIAERRVLPCTRSQRRVFGWWNRNLNVFAEAVEEKIARWISVVGAIRQEPDNRAVDLIQQAR